MRRVIITVLAAVVVVAGLATAVVTLGGGSSVTKPRLERSLPVAFANVYSQEAGLLGHTGVTPASMHAKAMCDNGSTNSGPGSTWICLMSWDDPNTPMPSTGYGKFELSVHSNDCYTTGSPSSLVGYQTLTTGHGQVVTNPAFEFDTCFDPHAANTPTGVTFPSAFSVTTTTLTPRAAGAPGIEVTCGTGAAGCAGTIAVTDTAGHALGSVPFRMAENASATLTLPALPRGVTGVTLTPDYRQGTGSKSSSLTVG